MEEADEFAIGNVEFPLVNSAVRYHQDFQPTAETVVSHPTEVYHYDSVTTEQQEPVVATTSALMNQEYFFFLSL